MRLALLVAAALYVSSIAAHADSLVLQSHSDTTYTYAFDVTSTAIFFPGQGFTITGLSGVTSASVNPGFTSFLDLSYTSNSVNIAVTPDTNSATFIGPFGSTFPNFFTITSAGFEGLAAYVDTGTPASSGTLLGPTGAVAPEPSTFALLATGMLGLAVMYRKRLA